MAPSATCPICSSPLALTADGSFDAWVCPEGHGLAATLSEAYERAQEDDLQALWAVARGASRPVSGRACPMCSVPMVRADAPFDDDEVPEGQPGDAPTRGTVPVDVCLADQVVWFDAGELEQLPADLPDVPPTAEQQAAIDGIARSFGEALVAADASRPGLADRILARVRA